MFSIIVVLFPDIGAPIFLHRVFNSSVLNIINSSWNGILSFSGGKWNTFSNDILNIFSFVSGADIHLLDLQSKETLFKFENYFEMLNVTKDQKYIVLYSEEENNDKIWSISDKNYVNFAENEIKELKCELPYEGDLYEDFESPSTSIVTHLSESIIFSFSYNEFNTNDMLKKFVSNYFAYPNVATKNFIFYFQLENNSSNY